MRRVKKVSAVAALAVLAASALLPPAANAVIGQVRATGDYRLAPNANNDPSRGKSGPNLAVNPANPNHIVEVHQELETEECEFNASFDGGTTWTGGGELQAPSGGTPAFPTSLPGPCDVTGHGARNIGQRSIAFGSGNNVYVSWTSTRQLNVQGFSLLLSKSTDGGVTYTTTVASASGVAPAPNYSRPELVVDIRSTTTDRIFIAVRDDRTAKAMVVRSEDAGATWAAPVEASNNNPGSNPPPTWNGAGTAVTTAGDAYTRANELSQPTLGPVPTGPRGGYRLVGTNGAVYAFGNAGNFGSLAGVPLAKPIVGSATTASGNGYWMVASDGGVFAFGDAGFFGSAGGIPLQKPIVGMAPTKSGQGYWLVASDGGIFAYGDATFHGSTGSIPLQKPIVGMQLSPTGQGYNLVASDGGIFSFGDAEFFGSTDGQPLAAPIVTVSPSNKVGGIRPLYVGYVAPKNAGACPPACENLGELSTDSYIVVAKSLDNGQTWTRARAINTRGFISPSGSLFGGSHWPRLAVGNGGEVFVTFNQGPGVPGSNSCGPGPFGTPGATGASTCPSFGLTPFKQADHFMNWDMDVFFMRSTNQAASFGTLKQLNEAKKPGLAAAEVTQTRHPEMIVTPDGRIDIAWEDRRHWFLGTSDRKNALVPNTSINPSVSSLQNYACVHSHSNCPEARLGDTYYSHSTDAGLNFSFNRRLNDRSHNNDVGYDYRFSAYWDYGPGIAALGNERLLVADMDARFGNPDNDSMDIMLRKVELNSTLRQQSRRRRSAPAAHLTSASPSRSTPPPVAARRSTARASRPARGPVR